MLYVWDPAKAASNLKKHGVSFEEARDALESDPNPVPDLDIDHADDKRLRILAWSPQGRVLFVVMVDADEDAIRIISARKATRQESSSYAKHQP